MKPDPRHSLTGDPAGRGALAAGAAHLLGRALGLLREVVFAATFGAGPAADAYNAGLRLVSVLRELLAEGSLSNVFVPAFSEVRQKLGQHPALRIANATLGLALLASGLFALLVIVAADPVVAVIAPGFDPGKAALTAQLTRLMAPFVMGLSITALLAGILNVSGRFFLPALAPSALNGLVILACLGAQSFEAHTDQPGIVLVALATTLSGFVSAAVLIPPLVKDGMALRPRLERHPELTKMGRFLVMAGVGVGVVQFNLLVETWIASTLGDGPVSYLSYAFRIIQLPQTVFSGSIAVAALAVVSSRVGKGEAPGGEITRALERNTLLVLPSAVGIIMLAEPLVGLFYGRGAFVLADVLTTAMVLQGYGIALLGICTLRVLVPLFFALGDARTPMLVALVLVVLKVPLALGLVAQVGLVGLPLSHAVLVTIEVVVLMGILHRRIVWEPGVTSQLLRMVLATGLMGVALVPVQGWTGPLVLVACGWGAMVFGVAARLLGVRALRFGGRMPSL